MRWLMAVVLVMVLDLNASAKELTTQEQKKQQWFHIATVGDVITTIAGASCVTIKEVNPILQGASPVGIVGFFVARNVAHTLITKHVIPDQWRAAWQNTWIGAQTLVVINNVMVLAEHC